MFFKNNGAFYATLSGLFFGLIGYFGISVIQENISVPNMLFWRFLISSLFIFFLLLPQLNSLKKTPIETLKVILYGLSFYGSTSIFYFMAAKYTGSGLAMVIFFTYPALVMLFNYILYKQKINRIYYLALFIIFIGMLCLVSGSQYTFNFLGLGFGLLSAVLYALYIIVSKNSTLAPLVSTFWVSLGSALICLVAALLQDSFRVPGQLSVWLNILGIGIICTALPIVLLLKGLKHISSLQVSILSVLEPVFVVIFGILLLGEKINLTQGLGILVLLSGALLSLLSGRFDGISKDVNPEANGFIYKY
ncbi:MAG: DMT family transporter [Tatlockia sp.]|nr:DMT family transporter [Tatlockia sp.]